jgi:hypothetical protein
VGSIDGGGELGGEAGWRRFGRGKVAGWASECAGALLEEGRRRGGAGGGRDAAAGVAREEGEGDWGGRRLKRGLTGGPHLSTVGRERERREVGRRAPSWAERRERPREREWVRRPTLAAG